MRRSADAYEVLLWRLALASSAQPVKRILRPHEATVDINFRHCGGNPGAARSGSPTEQQQEAARDGLGLGVNAKTDGAERDDPPFRNRISDRAGLDRGRQNSQLLGRRQTDLEFIARFSHDVLEGSRDHPLERLPDLRHLRLAERSALMVCHWDLLLFCPRPSTVHERRASRGAFRAGQISSTPGPCHPVRSPGYPGCADSSRTPPISSWWLQW